MKCLASLKICYPPSPLPENGLPSVFLAGSIDQGSAVDWQTQITEKLRDIQFPINIFNPRRKDWDSSWEQSVKNPKFVQQVEWELDAMDLADVIAFFFDPQGKAPITLMELGLHAASRKSIVCCPQGYWRKGNVDIVCQRYSLLSCDSIEDLASSVIQRLEKLS